MAKVKIKGSKKLLSDPVVQWEIYKSLLNQHGSIRKINYHNRIQGQVELDKHDTLENVMDLIKARTAPKKRGGELDLIKSLSSIMKETFEQRLAKMNRDILRITKGDD
jgi:hypothetical protein